MYTTLQQKIKDISFHNSLPSSFEDCDLFDKGNNHLIILDDLMTESVNSLEILKLFTMFRHHKGLSVILLSQNLFVQGKYARTLALNAQYYILFNNPRDRLQVRIMGQQMFPDDPTFLIQAYKDAVETPYNYLIIDLTQRCPEKCRVRSGLEGLNEPGQLSVVYIRE